MTIPEFIAHRGYTRHYPENTLIGIEAALIAGARFIEIDVQFTADLIPVLFHDTDLYRVTGRTGKINEMEFGQLQDYKASETARLKDQYRNEHIPSLMEFVELMRRWPDARSFVEIKTESAEKFGTENVTRIVMEAISPLRENCIPISYDESMLRMARGSGAANIGWIIKAYDDTSLHTAQELLPDFLFCNIKKLPPATAALWPGPWVWAIYEITDPILALELADRGAGMIETMEIGEMLQYPSIRDRISRAD
jgi:glycerophosphoryl diester phosphodiesterase